MPLIRPQKLLLTIPGVLIAVIGGMAFPAFAIHPQITDNTGTHGKGNIEMEINFQHDRDVSSAADRSIIKRSGEGILEAVMEGFGSFMRLPFGRVRSVSEVNKAGVTVTCGIIDPLDISIILPYEHQRTRERGLYYTYMDTTGPKALPPPGFDPLQLKFCRLSSTTSGSGLSDINVEFKWKIFEYKSLSIAFKPGIILPIGEELGGFGAGRAGGYAYFIMGIEYSVVIMNLNLGYIRNENIVDERKNIWHASLSIEYWLVKNYLRLVANAGLEHNPDRRSKVQDVFVLAGLIGSPTHDFDIDFGVKYCPETKKFESPGPDYSLLGGCTIRLGGADKEKKE